MPKPSAPKAKPSTPGLVKPSFKKAAKSNKGNTGDGDDTMVSWAKPEHIHITDALLTLIGDFIARKGAFGFDICAEPDPKGKNLIHHRADIAVAFFTMGDKDSRRTLDDIKMLKAVIKNRVST